MGETTYFTLRVLDCPNPNEREQIRAEVIVKYGLKVVGPCGPVVPPSFELGASYIHENTHSDFAEDLGQIVTSLAPGATFECSTEPTYISQGVVFMYAPDLGMFRAESAFGGEPVFFREDVMDVFREVNPLAGGAQIEDLIDRSTGGPWTRRISGLAERLPHRAAVLS